MEHIDKLAKKEFEEMYDKGGKITEDWKTKKDFVEHMMKEREEFSLLEKDCELSDYETSLITSSDLGVINNKDKEVNLNEDVFEYVKKVALTDEERENCAITYNGGDNVKITKKGYTTKIPLDVFKEFMNKLIDNLGNITTSIKVEWKKNN